MFLLLFMLVNGHVIYLAFTKLDDSMSKTVEGSMNFRNYFLPILQSHVCPCDRLASRKGRGPGFIKLFQMKSNYAKLLQ